MGIKTGYEYYKWLKDTNPAAFRVVEAFCKYESNREYQDAFMADLQLNGWLPKLVVGGPNDTDNKRTNPPTE